MKEKAGESLQAIKEKARPLKVNHHVDPLAYDGVGLYAKMTDHCDESAPSFPSSSPTCHSTKFVQFSLPYRLLVRRKCL